MTDNEKIKKIQECLIARQKVVIENSTKAMERHAPIPAYEMSFLYLEQMAFLKELMEVTIS